ncbi:uncharacterized protein LOC135823108 isoform X1 [Sycon ciliatum]|uniref:uncharacterized protein LOC135823108 isoform X1 n=2 Tax=Sycon ciliatum TaxID=27933 RepID=UPI0031F6EEF2
MTPEELSLSVHRSEQGCRFVVDLPAVFTSANSSMVVGEVDSKEGVLGTSTFSDSEQQQHGHRAPDVARMAADNCRVVHPLAASACEHTMQHHPAGCTEGKRSTPVPTGAQMRSLSYHHACHGTGRRTPHSSTTPEIHCTMPNDDATSHATASPILGRPDSQLVRLRTGTRSDSQATNLSLAGTGTLSTLDLSDEAADNPFQNPPSDRRYAPKRIQQLSLSSLPMGPGQKPWYHCKQLHRHVSTKQRSVRDLVRNLRKVFKRNPRLVHRHSKRTKKRKGRRGGMSSSALTPTHTADQNGGGRILSENGALTKSGICPDCSSVVPYTAHRAAISGHLECLKISVHRGCKVTSRSGDTLLHVAAKHCQPECLRWILEKCQSLKVTDTNAKANTVLHCAMDGGNVECVRMLFQAISGRPDPLVSDALDSMMQKTNQSGMTPLLVAVMHNQLELVRWLLSVFGARIPGAVNNSVGGATVFHYAAALGSVELLTLLHQHLPALAGLGVPKTGKLPIHLAVHTGHLEAAQFLNRITTNGLLAKSVDGMNCFHQAVQNGHLPCLEWMVKEMLAKGKLIADCLTYIDNEQASLFHFAAAFGETKCMQFLLHCLPDKSFAVNTRDVWGRTPLHDAAEKNHLNCFKLLLASGADIYSKDKKGNAPYEIAMKHGKLASFLSQNMRGDKAPPPKAPRTWSPDQDTVATVPLGRAVDHRTSVRYKAKAPRTQLVEHTNQQKSTTAPEHIYRAVTVSTSDDGYASAAAAVVMSPSPDDNMVFVTPPGSPDGARKEQARTESLNSDAFANGETPPASPGLLPAMPSKERSASVCEGMHEMAYTVPAPENQPSVKIIHAMTADSRITHEVSKLSFAMGMFNVNSSIVRVKKNTFEGEKVRCPAEMREWLEVERSSCDALIYICTSQLRELFETAIRGGKKAKDKTPDTAVHSFSLPHDLLSIMHPIVTLHGASSRHRPPWLSKCPVLYWPKNQPSLFAKLKIKHPEQQLSLPTRRSRANTM